MAKYLNIKTEIDGIIFDSKKESQRYIELRALERAGEISDLECQPIFKYYSDDGKKVLFKFIADFKYNIVEPSREYDSEFNICSEYLTEVVEDVKSPMTAKLPLFRLKKKLIEDRYNIKIEIV